MATVYPDGVQIRGPQVSRSAEVLSPAAVAFLAALQREFNPTRERLLAQRTTRQAELDAGALPDFLSATRHIRDADWRVPAPPSDLQNRRVEITGPAEPKMIINALNSGATGFMADFEDAFTPTWSNVIEGQAALAQAIRGTLVFRSPEGKEYRIGERPATLLVRPRGWHLVERHLLVDGVPMSASLFDFGLAFFHNTHALLEKGSGPYYYLPKMQSHLEARLWNEVFVFAQDRLGIPRGSIRATVLIEHILAAFEMEEILYELRDHSIGLNAGRWDYIFSIIKTFRHRPEFVLPDRVQVTMTVPFMRAYTELLVKTCHRRGAHAMGGMAAFIPSRRDPQVNEVALPRVRADKQREAIDGFDGTWVAHPDLVAVARDEFDKVLGERPHQIERQRPEVAVAARDLLDVRVPGGSITEAGLQNNLAVALQYIEAWLRGTGAVAIYNLMEDTATAEISRTQVWQWIRHGVRLAEGPQVTRGLVQETLRAVEDRVRQEIGADVYARGRFADAREVLEAVTLSEDLPEFLTLPAYERID
jgi:malate synthase